MVVGDIVTQPDGSTAQILDIQNQDGVTIIISKIVPLSE